MQNLAAIEPVNYPVCSPLASIVLFMALIVDPQVFSLLPWVDVRDHVIRRARLGNAENANAFRRQEFDAFCPGPAPNISRPRIW